MFTITVNSAPEAGLDGEATLCSFEGNTLDLNTLLSGHDAGGTWSEVTGSGQFSALGVFDATDLPSGVYVFKYTVAGTTPCAADEANFEVTLVDLPVANFSFTPGSVFTDDPEVTFTNSSSFSTHYEWTFGDGSPISTEENPVHVFPGIAGIYEIQLLAMNDLGCADSLKAYLKVKENVLFFIPNTFTPDGDAFNETFKPVFQAGYDPYDFHMTIYNRYGEIVFETYDASSGWNGTYGSQGMANEGVYTWQIEFKELNTDRRQQHSGHITILK
jgi:gliding motility-associated-like protein